jgi:hypothetical protein
MIFADHFLSPFLTPTALRSDYLIISRRPNKGLNFRVTHFLSYDANGRAYRD